MPDSLPFDLDEARAAVCAALDNPTAAVNVAHHEPIQVGSVGRLFRVRGSAATSDGDTLDWSLILKIQGRWKRPGDPECWRRELLAYRSGLFLQLPETLVVPACHQARESEGEIRYWFHELFGVTAGAFQAEHYAAAARHLAHLQGPYLAGQPLPDLPWLSSRRWVTGTATGWGTPAIDWLGGPDDDALPADLRDGVCRLWAERDAFLDVVDDLPLTLCHRDYNPENLFVLADGRTAVIDWDCVGIGSLAEDVGDLVGEALVFQGVDPSRAHDLLASTAAAYHRGLAEAGCDTSAAKIDLALAALMPLQWCFRVVSRFGASGDPGERERYTTFLRFLLDLADRARG